MCYQDEAKEFNPEDYGFTLMFCGPAKRDAFGRFRKVDSCCICGGELGPYGGNNPEPYMSIDEGKCCSSCDSKYVIPARMRELAAV